MSQCCDALAVQEAGAWQQQIVELGFRVLVLHHHTLVVLKVHQVGVLLGVNGVVCQCIPPPTTTTTTTSATVAAVVAGLLLATVSTSTRPSTSSVGYQRSLEF